MLPGPWLPVELPHKFSEQRTSITDLVAAASQPTQMTTTWYRISLDQLKPSNTTKHLYLIRWHAFGQLAIYGDGRLLYRSIGTAAWNFFRHPALFIALNQTAEVSPPKEILIRIDNRPDRLGAISSLYVGDTDRLYSRYTVREWFENQLAFMCSSAFLAVGFFSLVVWVVRRHELLYFLVFAIAVLSAIRRWHYYDGLEKLLIPDQWFGWITLNALNWQLLALHAFLGLLLQRSWPLLNYGLIGMALTLTLLTLPWPLPEPVISPLNLSLYLIPISQAVIILTLNIYGYWRSRSQEALLLVSWIFVAMLLGIYDWLNRKIQFNIDGLYWSNYGGIGLFISTTCIMFRRYVNAIGEIERVNADLEQRLMAYKNELISSHERLRGIERRETLSQERQRLMQDMHDGLGSSLTSALRVVEHGQLDDTGVALVLKGCIDDLKLAIDSMEPVEADLLLLLATLRFRLEPRLENSGIALRWEVENVPPLEWLDPRNSLHILRILQEAFTNIIKHTQATEIRVATGVEKDCVLVIITDNGQGFSVQVQHSGRGLSNQMRRAEMIGAKISWESSDAGTRLILRLPIDRRRA